jgi:hypothetical protein
MSSLFYLWHYSPCGPWPLFQFLNLYTVGRAPWTGDQPVARSLPTHRTTQTQNTRKQTSMPRMGFQPTFPVFELAKTVSCLDRRATVIGFRPTYLYVQIFSSTHCSQNTLSLRSSHNIRAQVSQPYKIMGKIIAFYIPMLTFLDRRRKYKLFWIE